jgi:hypothetical protein
MQDFHSKNMSWFTLQHVFLSLVLTKIQASTLKTYNILELMEYEKIST